MSASTAYPRPDAIAREILAAGLPEFTRHFDPLQDAHFYTVGERASGPTRWLTTAHAGSGRIEVYLRFPYDLGHGLARSKARVFCSWSRMHQCFVSEGLLPEPTVIRLALEFARRFNLRIYPEDLAAIRRRWDELVDAQSASDEEQP